MKSKGTTDYRKQSWINKCWIMSIILPEPKVYFVNNHTIAWSVSVIANVSFTQMLLTAYKAALNPFRNNTGINPTNLLYSGQQPLCYFYYVIFNKDLPGPKIVPILYKIQRHPPIALRGIPSLCLHSMSGVRCRVCLQTNFLNCKCFDLLFCNMSLLHKTM